MQFSTAFANFFPLCSSTWALTLSFSSSEEMYSAILIWKLVFTPLAVIQGHFSAFASCAKLENSLWQSSTLFSNQSTSHSVHHRFHWTWKILLDSLESPVASSSSSPMVFFAWPPRGLPEGLGSLVTPLPFWTQVDMGGAMMECGEEVKHEVLMPRQFLQLTKK